MPTRLLPKYEIDKRRAEEERQRMEEGLQIAGRVDNLRETVASEEVAFEKYRIGRLKSIQEEISVKQKEADVLTAQLVKDKVEHERLTAPLDERLASLEKFDDELTLREDSLKEKYSALVDKDTYLNLKEKSILEKENQTEIKLLSATSSAERAKQLFEQTKIASEKLRIEEMHRENELSRKEESFENIQKDFLIQRDSLMESLKQKETDLDRERAKITIINQQLADQRKTLERAMARLQK